MPKYRKCVGKPIGRVVGSLVIALLDALCCILEEKTKSSLISTYSTQENMTEIFVVVCFDALHSSQQFLIPFGMISCLPAKEQTKCLAKGHSTVTQLVASLELETIRSPV